MIGKTLSHYQIIEKLGEGGMGVVYKARDTRLKRPVALKFLPPESLQNKAKKAKLLQEAQAAAAINHLNICTVYEIDEVDGQVFIAMEYIEGVSLREKIKEERLKIKEVINYAMQIAEGLQAIHDKDMVHRDIKSDNIRITDKGQVKIMDFGLVKTSRVKETMSQEDTTGGTVAYMSPEQIRGEEVDHRTDIWSWGVVLYEMLSGQLPFKIDKLGIAGVYSILDEEPDPLQKICPDISPECLYVLDKALKKDREQRYPSMKDVFMDLKSLKNAMIKTDAISGTEPMIAEDHGQKINWRIIVPAVVFILLIMIITVKIVFQKPPPSQESKITRLTSLSGGEYDPALSPDGSKLAFSCDIEDNDNWDIYIKLIGEDDYHCIAASKDREYSAAWSPDGNSIAYIREGLEQTGIYQRPIIGGRETKLYTFNHSVYLQSVWSEIDWSPDGQWIAFSDYDSSGKHLCLYQIHVKTLEKEQLTFPGSDHLGDMNPTYSPDGHSVAFQRVVTYAISDLYILDLKNRQIRQVSFDDRSINGLAWTSDGQEIVISSNRDGIFRLWRTSAKGGEPRRLEKSGQNVTALSISRGGNRLAYTESYYELNVCLADICDTLSEEIIPHQLTGSSQSESFPVFSPDEKQIAFGSNRTGSNEIWSCKRDGSDLRRITSLNTQSNVPQWSPNGQWIVFDSELGGHRDILIVDALGAEPPRNLTDSPSDDRMPSWSRDGQWVYFGSTCTGEVQIHKINVQTRKLVQITTNGGFFGLESLDGKWLYFKKYVEQHGPIYKHNLQTSEESVVINENTWFDNWDVAEQGIVYIVTDPKGNYIMKRYRYTSETVEQVGILKQLTWHVDLSHDECSVLLTSGNRRGDTFLIEDFR
jgi:Tol biopolymer transport system component/tRNA A-37 threonylcarbamoyl transferase component Bud32